MQRREFLATTAILGATTLLHAREPKERAKPNLRVAVVGQTGRGNFGHGLDTMWLDLPGVEIAAVVERAAFEHADEVIGAIAASDYRAAAIA